MEDALHTDELYDLDDSLELGLSYFAAVLAGRDDDADTIEGLIDPGGLSTALLQVNFVLLSRLLELTSEEEVADGLAYLELFRAERGARVAAGEPEES